MIDNSKIQKVLALSDAELRQKITEAALAAGADKYKVTYALSDMSKLRNMISSLTPEQASALLASLGPAASAEITRRINELK